MPKRIFFLLLLAALGSQRSTAQKSSVLDEYLHLGLDSNLALHQRNFDLQRAELDLRRAQSLFYPQAGFSSQYTLANGGRTQAIPIGDLVKNFYPTLTHLPPATNFPRWQTNRSNSCPTIFMIPRWKLPSRSS